MSKRLTWDNVGEREYETGVSMGVLFVQNQDGSYKPGVAWSGLRSVEESPEGAEANDLYADNIKYATLRSAETFKFTIGAYMSPEEFDECDGCKKIVKGVNVRQQNRSSFGFAYRTEIGTDTNSEAGYKIHIVYGATASPSSKTNDTINESPEGAELSWECDTTPVTINKAGFKPASVIEINSMDIDPDKLAVIEDMLYGTESADSTLPSIDDLIDLLTA